MSDRFGWGEEGRDEMLSVSWDASLTRSFS
jgi:hypothetical protein